MAIQRNGLTKKEELVNNKFELLAEHFVIIISFGVFIWD